MNIVFAGTPAFALPCLNALMHSPHRLLAIYTQPDRPAGRGQKVQFSPVKTWALAQQLPVYQPINFKHDDALNALNALKPDVMVVIAYGLILPQTVLTTPAFGCINVHASLLPRWRGASPIQQAILHGDSETGVSIMQMDVGMDTGAVLNEARCSITDEDTAETLHDRLATLAVRPLLETLDALSLHATNPIPQNDEKVTYAPKINKEDAKIDWSQSAVDIANQIRAFNPWPIAFTYLGKDRMRIHHAHVVHGSSDEPYGRIVSCDKKGMLVACGLGGLMIEKIQFPGGKVIPVADWLNAHPFSLNNNDRFV